MIDKSKTRKKSAAFIAKTIAKVFFALVVLLVVAITAHIGFWKTGKADNLEICYNNITRDSVVSCYKWDGKTENVTITIPDKYKGIKVDSLGGTVSRTPAYKFYIDMPDKLQYNFGLSASYELTGEINNETKICTFTIELGKNIKHIEGIDYKMYYNDYNGNVKYVIESIYECSSENKWFYSENGKIYNKATNELID